TLRCSHTATVAGRHRCDHDRRVARPRDPRAQGPGMINRWLHPGAWWLWALGLGAAATRTANPLLLGLIVAVAALVVSARRPQAQWAGAFAVFVRLALLVIVIRVGFAVLFGVRVGTTDLFTLPSITLPEWMAGVTLGGTVTAEMLVIAFIQGAQLATLLI